jgi:hypothetical protein
MVRTRTLALSALGAVALGAVAWSRYNTQTTPRVPYETVGTVDDVELRRYPSTVVAETVAPSENQAFGRLFRYISGNNRSDTEVSMTAPVETESGGSSAARAAATGESISMTAPVETEDEEEGRRMAFYLPDSYDYESAPVPADPNVRLVEIPERTLAVKTFSWWATDGRVESKTEDLLETVRDTDSGVVVNGDPFLMRYDAPGTPPFLRTNEVAVEVRRTSQ